MAVTPQSIIRSPLLLLSLLVSTGIAIFGVSLFFGPCSQQKQTPEPCDYSTVKVEKAVPLDAGACTFVADQFADNPADWTEAEWMTVARCLENREASAEVIRVADRGLNFFPRSESLYNIKAYHQIELKRYDQAVKTLQTGLRMVTPSNGVMENNLAWAGLWEARRIDALEARGLYQTSLRRDGNSCEAIHTGLWVEYAVAMKYSGDLRSGALENYTALRARYDRCINRIDYGGEKTLFEILGAGVIDHEMDRLRVLRELETGAINPNARGDAQLVERAMTERAERFDHVDIDEMCAESNPVRTAAHRCRNLVRSELYKSHDARKRGDSRVRIVF